MRIMRQPRIRYFIGIVVAFGIHVAVQHEMSVTFGALIVVGLVVAWTCQLPLGDPPYAGNLPGVPHGPAASWPVNGVGFQRAAKVGLILLMGAAVVLAPTWALVGIGIPTLLVWVVFMLVAVRRMRHVRRLARALRDYAPAIGISYAGFGGGPLQIAMWEPYLLESGLPAVIFNWRHAYFDKILDGANPVSPLIQLSNNHEGDIRRLLAPSLKALFYVHNATQNKKYLAYPAIKHVWLGHGDSDKPASYLKRQADYDWLVMAGQAAIDRYTAHGIDVPADKFIILGRPQTSDIQPATQPISEVERPAVLYAPTWQGKTAKVDFSSLDRGAELIEALIDRKVRVIFRPHPLSYRWPQRREVIASIHKILAADADGGHIWGPKADTEWGIVECANASDAMISDVSSVVSDYLQSGKPYAMFNMLDTDEDFLAEFPIARSGYVIRGDLSNMTQMLDDLLGPDPLRDARAERRRYVLGGFEGRGSADAFASFVRELAAD